MTENKKVKEFVLEEMERETSRRSKHLEAQFSGKGVGVPLFHWIMLKGLQLSPPTCHALPLSAVHLCVYSGKQDPGRRSAVPALAGTEIHVEVAGDRPHTAFTVRGQEARHASPSEMFIPTSWTKSFLTSCPDRPVLTSKFKLIHWVGRGQKGEESRRFKIRRPGF